MIAPLLKTAENIFDLGTWVLSRPPKDATIEICSKPSSYTSSIIELSLTENLIHYRVDCAETGTRKYFVHPVDEARAREIVRQIEKGEPPQP